MSKQDSGRILYADILRIFTIFAVIVIHVCTARWNVSFGTSEWYVLNASMTSLRWCIPVFFMLSGIIILDPSYNLTFKKLYTKSLPRLVCALLFWAILYRTLSPAVSILLDIKEVTSADWHRIYTEIFLGTPWYHLWFMYAIISLYILAPLLRVFTAHAEKKHYIYFLILYFIFGALIPKINNACQINISFSIQELYSYTGYFIAGYFFAKFDLGKALKRIIYIAGSLALIWNVGSSFHFAATYGYPGTHYFENMGPQTMLIAFFVFVAAKDFISNNKHVQKLQGNKHITLLANCTLGIYLAHDLFNILLNLTGVSTASFPAILSVPILSLFVYLGSLCVVLVIRKIPILNKWII